MRRVRKQNHAVLLFGFLQQDQHIRAADISSVGQQVAQQQPRHTLRVEHLLYAEQTGHCLLFGAELLHGITTEAPDHQQVHS